MQLNFAPASAHTTHQPRLSSLLPGFRGRPAARHVQPHHPADYRSNGLESHEELAMAHQTNHEAELSAPAARIADEPQAARAPRLVPYVAFFVAVFASMAAAAAVVSTDLPVMVVGLM